MTKEKPPITEEERKEIHRAYRRLVNGVEPKMNVEDRTMVRKAYELAVKAHGRQRRKSGEPYVLHPIEVARICSKSIGLGPTGITSAILHDVVEDTPVTLEEIKEEFGMRVAKIVDGLTKLDGTYKAENMQAENFKKVLSTLVDDVRVALIKISDRLHNMRTLGAMPRHKQLKIAAETEFIYAPLSHRLGLYSIKTELQDLCFMINNPDTYAEIQRKLQETERERTIYIRKFIKPLKKVLDEIGAPYRIFGRPKSIYSINNKIKTKYVSFEEIYDIFAVRIVIDVAREDEKAICWKVYSLVTDVHKPIPERLKDWVTTPKSNGYESLHTTVIGPDGRFVEVQIRSERMDEIAERGFAAHWKYKGVKTKSKTKGKPEPDVYEGFFESIRDILESPNADALEFVSDIKTNLFQEEVYVYTPNGDMKVMPKGATALDFAFTIHTEVGYRSKAIKVNNKLVPMGYKLKNGDQVTIITDKNQKPTESWLKMVATGRARSKIRTALKEEEKKVASFGKETVQRKFNNLKITDVEGNVEKICRRLKYPSHLNFYADIALENININTILKEFKVEAGQLVLIEEKKTVQEVIPGKEKETKGKKSSDKARLLVEGQSADQFNYNFANCCNPVPGDDIFAFLTTGAGIRVHRSSCPNATNLMANYGYRIMRAEWAGSADSKFIVNLKIIGIDDGPGVIEKITTAISSGMGINIRSFSISGDEGYFEGNIGLLVANKDQLNVVIKNLKKLDNVTTVVREEAKK